MQFVFKENVLRVALIATNFIFAILSFVLVGLGVVYIGDVSLLNVYVLSVRFTYLPVVLIVLGVLSFVASLIGCYYAKNFGQKRFLKLFICFLGLLLAIEIAVSCIAFSNLGNELKYHTVNVMKKQLNDTDLSHDFHKIEEHLECCGVFGPGDYRTYSHTLPQNGSICSFVLDESNELTADGCAKLVFSQLYKLSKELFYVSAVYSVLQVVQIICLFNKLF